MNGMKILTLFTKSLPEIFDYCTSVSQRFGAQIRVLGTLLHPSGCP